MASEVQLVVFRLGSEEFGIDINEIREIIRLENITHIPNVPACIKGIINLRGSIVVVLDLALKLNLSHNEPTSASRIIIAEIEKSTIGLIVDSTSEVIRLRKEQIKPAPEIVVQKIHGDYLEGVYAEKDRLLIIIKLASLLRNEALLAGP